MKRPYLLAAIVLVISASLATAEENPTRLSVADDSDPFQVSTQVAEPPEPPADPASPSDDAREPELGDMTASVGGKSGQNDCFYPVCDPGCTIGCLDRWCDCDPICCVTNQWCDHLSNCFGSGNCYQSSDGCGWVCNDQWSDVSGELFDERRSALRFGWWGVSTQGSQQGTGEYQSLQSSPFWDVDATGSNGVRTYDFWLSGLDNETNNARMFYYGPNIEAKVNYNRFIHRLDHDPLAGLALTPPGPPAPGNQDNVVVTDLNVGDDYAIRVNMLDSRFEGKIRDNLKWKLNVWGMEKFGERQANATAHCYNFNAPGAPGATGNVCHVVSQQQNINWLTMEVTPGLEMNFDWLTVEYTRTMRSFEESDQTVSRLYTRFGFSPASGTLGPPYDYAMVPENFTQIDRLRFKARIDEVNDVYSHLLYGDTKNEFRNFHRQFAGYDVRWTNRSFDRLTLTAYNNMYEENNELPTTYLNAPPLSPANNLDRNSLRHPVDYQRIRAGMKGDWKPIENGSDWDRLRLVGGYEYYLISRDFASYPTLLGQFTQPDTQSHGIEIGPTMQWSPSLSSYIRYKLFFIDTPIIGVRENNGRFNTNQPENAHVVDVGGNWSPADNFMATAQIGFVNQWNHSEFARFEEDSYPVTLTLWHAPTDRLSLTTAYSYMSNWIDQDITLGFTTPALPNRTETTPWTYGGENHLVSLSANYAWTETVKLTGGCEWNRGVNQFSVPASPSGADWSLLPSLSDVKIQTMRYTAGVDWMASRATDVYLRYIYYDWEDIDSGADSGTAHMALAGASVTW